MWKKLFLTSRNIIIKLHINKMSHVTFWKSLSLKSDNVYLAMSIISLMVAPFVCCCLFGYLCGLADGILQTFPSYHFLIMLSGLQSAMLHPSSLILRQFSSCSLLSQLRKSIFTLFILLNICSSLALVKGVITSNSITCKTLEHWDFILSFTSNICHTTR